MFWIHCHCFLHAWATCKVLCSHTNEFARVRRYHERVQASQFRIDVGPFYEENSRHSSGRTSRSASPRWRASLLFARMKKIGKIRWINWSEINVEGKSMRKEIHILSNLRCSWKQRVCTTRVTQRASLQGSCGPSLTYATLQDLSQDKTSLGVFCFARTRTENQKLRRLTLPERQARKKSKRRFYGIFMVAQVAWLRDDEYLTVDDAARNGQAAWARLVL